MGVRMGVEGCRVSSNGSCVGRSRATSLCSLHYLSMVLADFRLVVRPPEVDILRWPFLVPTINITFRILDICRVTA